MAMFWITLLLCSLADVIYSVPDSTIAIDLADKPVWQSSVLNDSVQSYPGSLARDGCLEPYFSYGCCSSTDPSDDKYPWWAIDLGEAYTVSSVGLKNRDDKMGYKLADFHVYGSNTSYDPFADINKQTCVYRYEAIQDGKLEYLACEKGFTARYIIIQKNTPELVLCEVFLNAECPANTFGDMCQSCSANCMTAPCERATGTCQDGACTPGYHGPNCTQECPYGMYGDQCTSSCPDTCTDSCDHVTGFCHQGCKDGWTGDMCNKEQPSLHPGAIAAIAVVIVAVIGGLIAVVVFVIIKKRNQKQEKDSATRPVTNQVEAVSSEASTHRYELPVRRDPDTDHVYTQVF